MQRIAKSGGVLLIIDVEILDETKFLQYVKGHLPSVALYGGKIIFDSIKSKVLEGDWLPKTRLIIHQWESEEKLMLWYNSSEYEPWKELRFSAANVNATICIQREFR